MSSHSSQFNTGNSTTSPHGHLSELRPCETRFILLLLNKLIIEGTNVMSQLILLKIVSFHTNKTIETDNF
jgi:hypothetical protein